MTGQMTEAAFLAAVIKLAGLTGWRCYHTHRSDRSEPGFPDLVLVRERVLYRELKTTTGRLSADQVDWLDALAVAGVDAAVWRPDDLSSGRVLADLARTGIGRERDAEASLRRTRERRARDTAVRRLKANRHPATRPTNDPPPP